MEYTDLFETYRHNLERDQDDEGKMFAHLDDIEEAHYMDGAIDHNQYMILVKLYGNLTGDHAIIQ